MPPQCVSRAVWAWARATPLPHTERFVPGPFGHGGKKPTERNTVRTGAAASEAWKETDRNLPNELGSSPSNRAETESVQSLLLF